MKRWLPALVLALCCCPPASPQSSQANQPATMKKFVSRVLVDVVVTDSAGRPVPGLRSADFTVFEDGKVQQLRSFDEVKPGAVNTVAPLRPDSAMTQARSAPTGTRNSAEPLAPWNVLLWDTNVAHGIFPTNVHVDYSSQLQAARLRFIRFLQQKPPNARYALFLMTDRINLLQDFTDDASKLIAAMQRVETYVPAVVFPVPVTSPIEDPFRNMTNATLDTRVLFLGGVRNYWIHQGFRESEFASGGSMQDLENRLDGLQQLAYMLSALPGRKNVFWLTCSSPWGFQVNSEPLQQLAATLTPSRMAVYPIDWRGLTTDPTYDVTTIVPPDKTPAQALTEIHTAYSGDEAGRHAVLNLVAKETGGKAIYNTNDLGRAILDGTDTGAAYYTVTYAPAKKPKPGQLRHIRVELSSANHEYHLSYRHAYFTGPPAPSDK